MKVSNFILVALLIFNTTLAQADFVSENFTIKDTTDTPLAVEQAKEDYRTMLKIFKILTHDQSPRKINLVIYPNKTRFMAEKKGEVLDGLAEGYLMPDGSLTAQATVKRGVIAHELMHSFGYSINDPQLKEEFFCLAAQFLIDGFTPGTDLVFSGALNKK